MIYNIYTYDFEQLHKVRQVPRPTGGNHTHNKYNYTKLICAFDIETSNIPGTDYSTMYIWQFAIEDDVITGRTWDEYLELLYRLDQHLPEGQTLVIFVHNLSFEFQFLSGIYNFMPTEVFAVKSRKVLTCRMFGDRFEYRCAYLLTNMNLHDFTHSYHVEHEKLSGDDFNYDEVRYPWTELTPEQMQYCYNDVLGLVEAVKALMQHEHDTLYSLPLTSTGFVRRDVKRAAKPLRNWVHNMAPDLEVYKMLYRAFRGGDTHANRYYAGQTMHNVESFDRSSSYPDVCVNCKFPADAWHLHPQPVTVERLEQLIYLREKACLFDISLTNVRLRDRFWGCPYIPISKCISLSGEVNDNGRVLSANELTITLTDVDYRILQKEYIWDAAYVGELYYTRYDYMPKMIVAVINDYYRLKTELKGIKGSEAENTYMRAKAKLNSIYGMFATNPCKPDIIYHYEDGDYKIDTETDLEERLYKANRKSFVPYAYGVWCTAWARYRLHEGMWLVGTDRFLYTDTDSIKYINEGDPVDWDSYNKQRIEESVLHGAFAKDSKGKPHYMGVFEQEDHIDYFKSLGAKKYCCVTGDRLSVTVAGVTKDQFTKAGELVKAGGGTELLKMSNGNVMAAIDKYFSDDALRPTVFKESGGLEAKYYDGDPVLLQVDGHRLVVTRCIKLQKGEYTLGITGDYDRILKQSAAEWIKMDLLRPY